MVRVRRTQACYYRGLSVSSMDMASGDMNRAIADGTKIAARVDGPPYWFSDAVTIEGHTKRMRAQDTSGWTPCLPFTVLKRKRHTATKTAPMPPKLPASGITAAAAKTLNASGRSDEEVPEQNARLKRHR